MSDLSISVLSEIPPAVHHGIVRVLEANPTLDHDRLIAIALCQFLLPRSPSPDLEQVYTSLVSGS